MAQHPVPTRERIVAAASKLFYGEGIGRVSMDAVAEGAGVTKRTLYYHFRSKDDLVAAYLDGRDQPSLALFQRWFEATQGGLAEKIRGIFTNLAVSARHPKWKGCGFLRTTAELAHMPGHPAIEVGAGHKKRQIVLLLDGSFAVALLHRDPSYMETAGEAAFSLVRSALSPR